MDAERETSPALPPLSPLEAGRVRVSAVHVRALGEALELAGATPQDLFARCRLDFARLQDPYGWFEVAELDRLMVTAAELTNDPAFGLLWGARSPMLQYELLPVAQAHAPTLRAAIEFIVQVQRMLSEHAEASFSERGDLARITIDPLGVSEEGRRIRTEFALTGLHRLFFTEGCERSVVRFAFAYPRPAYGAEYDRLFGARVRFDQTFSGVELERIELDHVRPQRNAELHDALRKQLDQLGARLQNELTHAQRVKQEIRVALPRVPSMDDLARGLATSVRSLRRRLAEEGKSYTELLDEVQRERTSELLARGDRPIKQVASEVGFDSASGFHRAYRRWTGATPGARTSARRSGSRGDG